MPLEDGFNLEETRLGETRSTAVHESHELRQKRGVIWCSRCGSYATRRGRALLRPCLVGPGQKADKTGSEVLRRLALGLTPTSKVKRWPEDA